MKDFTTNHFGDSKLSKDAELKETMSIRSTNRDSYEAKIMNINGGSN